MPARIRSSIRERWGLWVLVTLAMAQALSAPAAAALAEPVLALRLSDERDHSYTYRTPVEDSLLSDPSGLPDGYVREHLDRARRAMAISLGYTPALLGPDHHKVLGPVRVTAAWIERGWQRQALEGLALTQSRRGRDPDLATRQAPAVAGPEARPVSAKSPGIDSDEERPGRRARARTAQHRGIR